MICVLQFDAASVAVVRRMLDEGRLPNLAVLERSGRRVELATPAVDFAAGAFPTLYSGVELGDHGVFYPFQWAAAEQRAHYAANLPAPPAVWERLAAGGLRTLAIDPYESRPPQRPEGVFVCGWGFADRVVLPRWSRPEDAGRRYARLFGRGPGATEIFGRPRVRDLLALREKLVAAPGRIADLAEDLLARESFDLAWLTFSAAHLAGHQFWDLSQLDAAALAPAERATLEAALGDVYAAVDDAFGRILAVLPAGADVIVTSAAGMDVNTSRADLLPAMLARVLASGRDRRRRGRRDLAPARGAAWVRASAGRGRDPGSRGAGAHGPPRAARHRLDDHPRLRPPGRQPGLRAAQPARPRARRDRRPGRGRRAARGDRRGSRDVHRPRRRPGGRVGASAPPSSTRAPAPRSCPTWSCAGRSGPPRRSRRCARRASATCTATGAAPGARATTRQGMPGRWWCRGRHRTRRTARRRGSWTWRRRCARSRAPTRVA